MTGKKLPANTAEKIIQALGIDEAFDPKEPLSGLTEEFLSRGIVLTGPDLELLQRVGVSLDALSKHSGEGVYVRTDVDSRKEVTTAGGVQLYIMASELRKMAKDKSDEPSIV